MQQAFRHGCTFVLIVIILLFAVAAFAQEDPNCPGAPVPRLVGGEMARVLPGDPNNVRDSASRSGVLVGAIPGAEAFTVLDGPVCADGLNWWQVEYGDITGWTVEGAGTEYWVEPAAPLPVDATEAPAPTATAVVTAQPVPEFQPPVSAVNVLEVGTRARVINDDPASETITLTIRAEPGRSAGGLAQALEGDLLTIVGGPEEADGLRWWQVETAGGTQGWVVEGLLNGDTYERTLLATCPLTEDRLVFRVNEYIVTTTEDGSDPCILDRTIQPAWTSSRETAVSFGSVPSPDGLSFIYVDHLPGDGGNTNALFKLNVDGSERLRLMTGDEFPSASWSPNGQKIAIATGTHIGILNSDGSSYYTLTQPGNFRTWVEWLADNESVMYLEQDRLPDQMGTAIEYVVRRVNTQEGGLHDVLEFPLGWDLFGLQVSPDRSMLAASGRMYGLEDGMEGTDPVKRLALSAPGDATTQITDINSGTLVVEQPIALYALRWLPDGNAVFGITNADDAEYQIVPVTGGEPYSVTLSGEFPEGIRDILRWVDDSVFVFSVYDFQGEPDQFGIWAVDFSTGEVVQHGSLG